MCARLRALAFFQPYSLVAARGLTHPQAASGLHRDACAADRHTHLVLTGCGALRAGVPQVELQTSDVRRAGTTGHAYLTIIGEDDRLGGLHAREGVHWVRALGRS